jgi:multicomponent Na+:H+ antiporter subunit C
VLSLLAAGGRSGAPPIANSGDPDISDPLPQAFSLTAIVISFGLTLFVLALARRQQLLTGDDLVEDDIEDRRIAAIASGPDGSDGSYTADSADGSEAES